MNPHTNPAFLKLARKYPQLKRLKGVDFHSLDHANFSLPMMIELGVPIHEIIIGRMGVRGGRERLIKEVRELFHTTGPAKRHLNFHALVEHGVPITTLREYHVPYGLLLLEGFTKEELVEAGYEAGKIDAAMNAHKTTPTIFPKNPVRNVKKK